MIEEKSAREEREEVREREREWKREIERGRRKWVRKRVWENRERGEKSVCEREI